MASAVLSREEGAGARFRKGDDELWTFPSFWYSLADMLISALLLLAAGVSCITSQIIAFFQIEEEDSDNDNTKEVESYPRTDCKELNGPSSLFASHRAKLYEDPYRNVLVVEEKKSFVQEKKGFPSMNGSYRELAATTTDSEELECRNPSPSLHCRHHRHDHDHRHRYHPEKMREYRGKSAPDNVAYSPVRSACCEEASEAPYLRRNSRERDIRLEREKPAVNGFGFRERERRKGFREEEDGEEEEEEERGGERLAGSRNSRKRAVGLQREKPAAVNGFGFRGGERRKGFHEEEDEEEEEERGGERLAVSRNIRKRVTGSQREKPAVNGFGFRERERKKGFHEEEDEEEEERGGERLTGSRNSRKQAIGLQRERPVVNGFGFRERERKKGFHEEEDEEEEERGERLAGSRNSRMQAIGLQRERPAVNGFRFREGERRKGFHEEEDDDDEEERAGSRNSRKRTIGLQREKPAVDGFGFRERGRKKGFREEEDDDEEEEEEEEEEERGGERLTGSRDSRKQAVGLQREKPAVDGFGFRERERKKGFYEEEEEEEEERGGERVARSRDIRKRTVGLQREKPAMNGFGFRERERMKGFHEEEDREEEERGGERLAGSRSLQETQLPLKGKKKKNAAAEKGKLSSDRSIPASAKNAGDPRNHSRNVEEKKSKKTFVEQSTQTEDQEEEEEATEAEAESESESEEEEEEEEADYELRNHPLHAETVNSSTEHPAEVFIARVAALDCRFSAHNPSEPTQLVKDVREVHHIMPAEFHSLSSDTLLEEQRRTEIENGRIFKEEENIEESSITAEKQQIFKETANGSLIATRRDAEHTEESPKSRKKQQILKETIANGSMVAARREAENIEDSLKTAEKQQVLKEAANGSTIVTSREVANIENSFSETGKQRILKEKANRSTNTARNEVENNEDSFTIAGKQQIIEETANGLTITTRREVEGIEESSKIAEEQRIIKETANRSTITTRREAEEESARTAEKQKISKETVKGLTELEEEKISAGREAVYEKYPERMVENEGGKMGKMKSLPVIHENEVLEDVKSTGLVNAAEIDELREALREEETTKSILYGELDKERQAAAIAAQESMAMITRLQEEKSAMQMEVAQFRRMTEEKALYDQEAMVILKEILLKREKEKHALEKEVELYRERLLKSKVEEMKKKKEKNAVLMLEGGGPEASLQRDTESNSEGELMEFSEGSEFGTTTTENEETQAILDRLWTLEEELQNLKDITPDPGLFEESGNMSPGGFGQMKGRRRRTQSMVNRDRQRSATEEEVNELTSRLQSLEADREALKKNLETVKEKTEGLNLLEAITKQLQSQNINGTTKKLEPLFNTLLMESQTKDQYAEDPE